MRAAQESNQFPWNHGRIVGPKPPLKPKQIWAIRTRLQHEGRVRDLAMFNVAIDSKLRGCDLVRLRVADIHLGDSIRLRSTIVQQKNRAASAVRVDRTNPGNNRAMTSARQAARERLAVSEPKSPR